MGKKTAAHLVADLAVRTDSLRAVARAAHSVALTVLWWVARKGEHLAASLVYRKVVWRGASLVALSADLKAAVMAHS